MSAISAILESLDLALAPWGGLKPEEAEKCLKLALRHLLNRSTGVDTLMLGVSMRRAAGLAKIMAVGLRGLDRQVHIDVAPTALRRSAEQMFDWIRASAADNQPVLVQLTGQKGRSAVVAGIDQRRICLCGSGIPRSIRLNDPALRRDLQIAGMFRVRVVRLESIFEAVKQPSAHGHRVTVHG